MTTNLHQAEVPQGLEVAPPGMTYPQNDKLTYPRHSTLEFVPPSYEKPRQGINDYQVDQYQQHDKQAIPSKRPRRKLVIIGLIIAVIIVAAVVGGVCGALLGTKSRGSESASSMSSTLPPSPSSTSVISDSSALMAGNAVFPGPYLSPSAVTWGYPHMEIFTLTSLDGVGDPQGLRRALWLARYPNATGVTDWALNRRDAKYGPFTYITGDIWALTHSLTPVARSGNLTDIDALGTGNHGLWTQTHNSSMYYGFETAPNNPVTWISSDTVESAWIALFSAPGIGSCSKTSTDVFALRENGQLWRKTSGSSALSWSSWQPLGGNYAYDSAPKVISSADNRCDIFVVNQDNKTLTYLYYTNSHNDTLNLGGQLSSRPAAVSPQNNRIDLFARGGDAGLWHLLYNNGKWGTWSRVGNSNASIKAEPSAVVLKDQIHVFAWSAENELLYGNFNWQTGISDDMILSTIATDLVGAPTAISDGVNVEVFAHLASAVVGWKVLQGGAWSPSDQTMGGLWRFSLS